VAWVERRGGRCRIVFRFQGERIIVNLKAADAKDATACCERLEENLRLVERGRLSVPESADLGLFLLSDGKLEQPVKVARTVRLLEIFEAYQRGFTEGAKDVITRKMEDVHLKHVARILGNQTPLTLLTAASVQEFVDRRSQEKHRGRTIKPKTVRKAVATFRYVWNWAHRQRLVPTPYPAVELTFPKEKQAEPFRTYDQIQAILARRTLDPRRIRELWDGLFLDPKQVEEVLATVKGKTWTTWLYPFAVVAAHTGGRRGELFRAQVEDFDFDGKLVLLREKKRSRTEETFRTVDMTPTVERVMKAYFKANHPGGGFAFSSEAGKPITDGQAWKALRTALKGSKWAVLRGYHAFRHSFASNLAAAGVDQRLIDELMGHTTVEMQKRYRHLFPDQRRAAVFAVYDS
jgi:integrase